MCSSCASSSVPIRDLFKILFYFLVSKALFHRSDGVLNTNKVLKAENLILRNFLKNHIVYMSITKILFNVQEK